MSQSEDLSGYESIDEPNVSPDTARLVEDTEIDIGGEASENFQLSPQPLPSRSCWKSSYVYICCVIASVGGVLFGYDIGIIAGALSQLTNEFCLTDWEKEVVVSSLLVGAFVGSLIVGFVIDRIGRRLCIIVNNVVFIVGAILLAAAVGFPMLIIGRFIIGFAVSTSIVAEIAYISEVAPPKRRGLLVAWNELGIVSGFLLAYVMNLAFVTLPYGWRLMFGVSILPASVQGVLLFFTPASPRYLAMKGKVDQAGKVLKKLRGDVNINKEMEEIKTDIESSKKHSAIEIFLPRNNMLFRFIIGGGLCVFQQASGQPAVLYYAPLLLKRVGLDGDVAANLATVGLGVAKFIAIVLCVLTVDKVGRRLYLLAGTFVMVLCLVVVSLVAITTPSIVALHNEASSVPCVLSVVNQSLSVNTTNGTVSPVESVPVGAVVVIIVALGVYIAGYEFSYGAVSWILLGELFPAEVRGRAISIATSLNWLANLVIAVSMLSLLNALHGFSYLVYAGFTLIGFTFILVLVPETKEKSLEELSKVLSVRKFSDPFTNWKERGSRFIQSLPCLQKKRT